MKSAYDTKAGLVIAMQMLDLKTFKAVLLELKTEINVYTDSEGFNIFHELASCNIRESNIMEFQMAIEESIKDSFAEDYKTEICKMINSPTEKEKNTPLHIAVMKQRRLLVAHYIQLGADMYKKNADGQSIVHLSAQSGMIHFLVNCILNWKMTYKEANNAGKLPLHIAVDSSHELIVGFLLSLENDVNQKDNDGNTPLHLAATSQNYSIIRLLLMNGAKRSIKNNCHNTPLDIAVHYSAKALYKLLKKPGVFKKLSPCSSPLEPLKNSIWFFLFLSTLITRNLMSFYFWIPNFPIYLVVISVLTFVFSISSFLTVHNLDPGFILPKKGENLLSLYEKYHAEYICPICKVKKSYRSRHCQHCGKCVKMFDHHCPWILNCVGKSNFRAFYLFLIFTIIDLSYHFCISLLILLARNDKVYLDIPEDSTNHIVAYMILAISCLGILIVLPVFYIQTINVIQKKTTHERFAFKSSERLSQSSIEDPRYTIVLSDLDTSSLLLNADYDPSRRTPNFKNLKKSKQNYSCFKRREIALEEYNDPLSLLTIAS